MEVEGEVEVEVEVEVEGKRETGRKDVKRKKFEWLKQEEGGRNKASIAETITQQPKQPQRSNNATNQTKQGKHSPNPSMYVTGSTWLACLRKDSRAAFRFF